MKKADLVFVSGDNIVSVAIQRQTIFQYDHVMIATGRGMDVISADAEGVVVRMIRPSELGPHAVLSYWPELRDDIADKIVDWGMKQVGKGYDFLGLGTFLAGVNMNDEDRWFCSELCFMAYHQAGIDLLKRIDHAFVSPRDLYISPLLERI